MKISGAVEIPPSGEGSKLGEGRRGVKA